MEIKKLDLKKELDLQKVMEYCSKNRKKIGLSQTVVKTSTTFARKTPS